MRRTGKQGLYERIRQGEYFKRIRSRARDKSQLSEDFSGDYLDLNEDPCQDQPEPTTGEKPCK